MQVAPSLTIFSLLNKDYYFYYGNRGSSTDNFFHFPSLLRKMTCNTNEYHVLQASNSFLTHGSSRLQFDFVKNCKANIFQRFNRVTFTNGYLRKEFSCATSEYSFLVDRLAGVLFIITSTPGKNTL